MTVLKIHDYLADPRPLRRVAREVRPEELFSDPFAFFVRDLVETLHAHRAMGLAATQLDATAPDGEVWKVFAMRVLERGPNPAALVVVNPVIVKADESEWGEEGCLSFRSVGWKMFYPTRLEARGIDDDGKPLDLVVTGLEARCFFHEEEHLRGRTMIDRMPKGERKRFLSRVAKVRRP